jgi:uncharacterized YigZ family protein
MKDDTYLTIADHAEGLYKEKGSKFIALAYPVSDEEEIKSLLENIRKKYYDARHHCYAYRLGREGLVFRANDAGEPNHSAGDPILGQLRSYNITDVLIVVVRYFGGTKLGVGGLINAYKTAAADAIENSTIITKITSADIRLQFDYLAMNDVMRLVKDYDLHIKKQEFENTCHMVLEVRMSLQEEVRAKLSALVDVQVKEP